MNRYDVLIIGAGHNGLTAAAYLAKAGKRVLVPENVRSWAGFVLGKTTPRPWPRFPRGMLRPDIVRHLGLERFGLNPSPAATDRIPSCRMAVNSSSRRRPPKRSIHRPILQSGCRPLA